MFKNIIKLLVAGVFLFSGCSTSEKNVQTNKTIKVNDEQVLSFAKTQFQINPRIKIENISIKEKKEVPSMDGWMAYILDISLSFSGKNINISDIMFTNGTVITQNFFDLNTRKSIRDSVLPLINDSYYDQKHFLVGNPNGKNKVVIFSDPNCPFCINYVPDVIKYIKENTQDTALYYYHYPIETIHPMSVVIIKAMLVAQMQGVKDVVERVYKNEFTPSGISKQESLDEFNKVFNTKITLEDINNQNVVSHFKGDIKAASDLMISGTPTIFVNGKRDNTKEMYKELK